MIEANRQTPWQRFQTQVRRFWFLVLDFLCLFSDLWFQSMESAPSFIRFFVLNQKPETLNPKP